MGIAAPVEEIICPDGLEKVNCSSSGRFCGHDYSENCPNLVIYDSNNSNNKMQHFHVYYLTSMCGSTCFGRLPAHYQGHTTALAHYQGHTTALGVSGFTVGREAAEARPRPKTLQPLPSNNKTRGT